MTTRVGPGRLWPAAALAMVLAACSTGTGASPATVPPGARSVAPSVATAASPFVSAAPSQGSASPSAAIAVISDGVYTTAAIPIARSLARMKADKTLTAPQRADVAQQFSGHTSQTFRIELKGGVFTEYETYDGGSFDVGARASFVFPDAHTLLIQESCCGTSTFNVTRSGSGFSLRHITLAHLNAEDNLLGEIVYESAPFLAIP